MPESMPGWRKSEIGLNQTREAWICRSGLGQMIVFKGTSAYHMRAIRLSPLIYSQGGLMLDPLKPWKSPWQ
jgi:hypothetical protein